MGVTRKFTTLLRVYTCLQSHVENIVTIKMSSKKNKSKSKKSSEGDDSLVLKESSRDSSNLQTPGQDGGSCKSSNCNSFTVTDFIEKGKTDTTHLYLTDGNE